VKFRARYRHAGGWPPKRAICRRDERDQRPREPASVFWNRPIQSCGPPRPLSDPSARHSEQAPCGNSASGPGFPSAKAAPPHGCAERRAHDQDLRTPRSGGNRGPTLDGGLGGEFPPPGRGRAGAVIRLAETRSAVPSPNRAAGWAPSVTISEAQLRRFLGAQWSQQGGVERMATRPVAEARRQRRQTAAPAEWGRTGRNAPW